MRRILTSVVLLVLLSPSLALGGTVKSLVMGVTMDELVYRESGNSYYEEFTNVPFSGTVKGRFQGKIKNGKKVGPWITYQDN